MALVKQKHLNLYKRYITQLVDDLSQNVVLHTEDVDSQCTNCIYDHVHKCSSGKYNGSGPQPFSGGICPVCNGSGKITTATTQTIKCTVNWGNLGENDEFTIKPGGKSEYNFFQIKALIKYYTQIKEADYLTIDGVRCILLNIIKRGLKENVVCIGIGRRDD
jgi:hypothetical protein